jgi:hypothetical protein
MEPSSENLKAQILSRLEDEAIEPRSKWVCSTQEYGVWALWLGTVVLGALSVAVTFFVVSHQRFALYEVTHESFLAFAVEVLPYLWIGIFALMAAFAVVNLRHTKRGYRYPLSMILGSSVLLSFALGGLLHLAGLGFSLDNKMGAWVKGYASQERMELKWWQNPEAGRLVGKAMYVRESDSTDLRFIDMAGTAWQLELDELHDQERQLLTEGRQVRLFGTPQDATTFHACGAMPWVQDRSYRGEELDRMRQEARVKIKAFKEEKMVQMASSTVCAQIMATYSPGPVPSH